MSKFFVKENQINNDKIHILGEDVNHIANVLRMKKEDEVQICNQETGENYITKIISFSKDEIECEIVEKIIETVESNVDITLFQGIPKLVVKLDEKTASKKIERWQKIAEVAAKQSMRDIIPEIGNIVKLKDITKQDYDVVLVAYENEEKNMLKQELKKLQGKDRYKIAIVIGPEGGISEKEIEILKNMGTSFVSLGKRILRTETAGIVMSGNIMYELED